MNAHSLRYVLPAWVVVGVLAVTLAAAANKPYDYTVPSAPDPISGIMSTSNFDFQKLIAPVMAPWTGGTGGYVEPVGPEIAPNVNPEKYVEPVGPEPMPYVKPGGPDTGPYVEPAGPGSYPGLFTGAANGSYVEPVGPEITNPASTEKYVEPVGPEPMPYIKPTGPDTGPYVEPVRP